jgi:transketolase
MADKEMRAVYAQTLIELAEKDDNIVVLEADLMKATGTASFKARFPERTFNVGVAEANMVGIAAGLSAAGKIPFAASFACFAARRAYDQFFISGNYARQNIKLVGTDPGVAAAYNGGTHMPFEDVGIIRNIPKIVIVEPSDPVSLKAVIKLMADYKGCTYLRLFRKAAEELYKEDENFELGKGKILHDGNDITLIACGVIMVKEALKAREILESKGLSAAVIDMHTIKPLDNELVIRYAMKTKAVISCENHQVINGLGSAVAECLSENYPVKMKRIGIQDEFGEVGTQDYLQKRFGLTAENIVTASCELLSIIE